MRRNFRERRGLVTSNERSFYWRLTGRENLVFFAALYQIPRREGQTWMEELYDALGLREIIDVRFDHYSTGQKQRMAIARGLLSKPKILLMDEPTKGVDPLGASKLVTIIRERLIQLWNPTILVTSHNLFEIERLCDRIALMDHGRIIAVGELEELRTMVGPVETYQLMVRLGSEQEIRQLCEQAGACPIDRLAWQNGAAELEVSFPQGTDGFPRMIRSIVEAGGDVLTCTSVDASLDDVFHALIAKQGPRDPQVD